MFHQVYNLCVFVCFFWISNKHQQVKLNKFNFNSHLEPIFPFFSLFFSYTKMPASTSSLGSSQFDVFTEPVLPWLDRPATASRSSSQNSSRPSLVSNASSDIHIMKRYVPEGAPKIPEKKWKFWKWQKVWLLVMNSLVNIYR